MTETECGRVFELLSEYLDQELAPAECEELERHLRGCPQCIQFVRSLKRSVQLCRQFGACWTPPPLDPEAMSMLRQTYQKALAKRKEAGEDLGRG